jgi:hypothetical protein
MKTTKPTITTSHPNAAPADYEDAFGLLQKVYAKRAAIRGQQVQAPPYAQGDYY